MTAPVGTAGPAARVSAAGIDPELVDVRRLDCWEVNLAVALAAVGERDIRSLLGAQWWFAPAPGPTAAPALDFEEQSARIARLTGRRPEVVRPAPGALAGTCSEIIAAGGVPVVVADAHDLPWTPYAGRRHVEHSLVVTAVGAAGTAGPPPGALAFTDAYDNRTEWGDAVPLDGVAGPDVVAAMERADGVRVVAVHGGPPGRVGPSIDRRALLVENATALGAWATGDPYASLADPASLPIGDAEAFAAFCELCWTIERRRALFGRWLEDLAADPDVPEVEVPQLRGLAARFAEAVPPRWSTVNRFAYLALRRLRAGHAASPDRIADLVAAAADAERSLAADVHRQWGA
ncbi:MAG TPA: hypothetical protein VD813_15120 [Pseudonocardia sp.]|nr:hypothetical protein [Pseudonocardia sp.]